MILLLFCACVACCVWFVRIFKCILGLVYLYIYYFCMSSLYGKETGFFFLFCWVGWLLVAYFCLTCLYSFLCVFPPLFLWFATTLLLYTHDNITMPKATFNLTHPLSTLSLFLSSLVDFLKPVAGYSFTVCDIAQLNICIMCVFVCL